MNKRERFNAFLHNEPVDRVPVGFFHHYMTDAEYSTRLKEPRLFEKMVAGHLVSKRNDDADILKIMNDVLMVMPIDVSNVKEPKDLKLVVPPKMDSEYVEKTKELTERVLKYYEDEDIPSLATGFSPFFNLRYALRNTNENHLDVVKEFFLENPEGAKDAMNIVADMTLEMYQMLMKDLGIDGIYFSVNNQNELIPDDFYHEYVTPVEQRMLKEINKDGISFLHVCGFGGMTNNIQLFKDYDATAINWAVYAEGISLKEGKEIFGGKPVMGGFAQNTIIYNGTEEEVKNEVKRILEESGQIGVMIGADCTVPHDIDEHRFAWARQAAQEFADEHK